MSLYFRHITLFIGFAFFALLSCQEKPTGASEGLTPFKTYLGTKPQTLSRLRPAFLSEFGRYGHSLDRLDLASKKAEISMLKEHAAMLKGLPPEQDSLKQLKREADLWIIERKIEMEPFLLYQDPLNPLNGFHQQLLLAFQNQYLESKEDTEAYNARMRMIPRQISEVISLLQERHKVGIRSPKLLLEAEKEHIENFLQKEIQLNPLYKGLAIKLNQIDVTVMNLYQASDYLQVTEMNFEDFVRPAYEKLLKVIEELLAESSDATGTDYVEYEKFYAAQLHRYNGKKIAPESLFEAASKELDSLQQLILPLEEKLQANPLKKNTTPPRKTNRVEQVQMFSIKMRKAREGMIGLFDSLPQRSPEVMIKPAYVFQEELLVYEAASLDQARQARIVVDFERWNSARPYQQLSELYSKIYPGSFTQDKGAHQELSYISEEGYLAWQEGWKNYVLRLADQPLYLFSVDDQIRLDFLKDQSSRVAQVVLDLGIHHKKWSRDEIAKFLTKHGPQTAEKRKELWVKSYADPGALTASWVGGQEFQRLANYTSVRFSPQITQKTFHEISLKNGPLPWQLLQKSIGLY